MTSAAPRKMSMEREQNASADQDVRYNSEKRGVHTRNPTMVDPVIHMEDRDPNANLFNPSEEGRNSVVHARLQPQAPGAGMHPSGHVVDYMSSNSHGKIMPSAPLHAMGATAG